MLAAPEVGAEQTPKVEEKEKKEDSEATAFWTALGQERTEDYKVYIKRQMKEETLEHNGQVYKYSPVKGKDIIRFKKLDADSFKIEDKDSKEFYDNVRERACLLIQDMTPEKFDGSEYAILENLTTAWSRTTLGGFRVPKFDV